jgi:peptidoglycan/xylan/chitin deacetylase (PgdA/CDA1 family)
VTASKAMLAAGVAAVIGMSGMLGSRPIGAAGGLPSAVPNQESQQVSKVGAVVAAPVGQAKVTAPTSVNCRKVKCVALTFDDGPVPQTVAVVDTLARHGARATFFVLGKQAQAHPEILRRMAAGGNAVGDHSWSHPMFSRLSSKAIRNQLVGTEKAITRAIGKHQPLVRPPYGDDNKRVRQVVAGIGAPVILWSVDPLDWKDRNTKVVTKRVLSAVRRNSIVLMHDIHPTSRAAVAGIVEQLQARGYVLVTVPELIGSKAKPGARITRG